MKRFLAIILSLCCLVLVNPLKGDAYSRTNPAPNFDPNNLISDSDFTAYGMSDSDIAAFLTKNNSWLSSYIIPATQSVYYQYKDINGNCQSSVVDVPQEYTVGGSNISFAGISASQLIGDTAHQYHINPKVLLVTLEKESGAISSSVPPNSATSAWVLGFGWDDTMASCQYSQSDAQKRAIDWGGVGQQIVYSVQYGFSKWFNDPTDHPSNFTVSWSLSDPTQLPIQANGRGTTALYVYTPYVYNGNYNFWYLFNVSPVFSLAPTKYQPALGLGPDGTVYIIDSDMIWPVSAAGFQQWGFSWSAVAPLTTAQQALPVGNVITPLAEDSGGTIYYISNGYKRAIASPRIFLANNFSWSGVSIISDTILNQLPDGLPLYELVKIQGGDGTVYAATNGVLYPISGDIFYDAWSLNINEAATVPAYVFTGLPIAPLLNRLVVAVGGDGTAYLVDAGTRYPLSAAVAQAWNLNLSQISAVGLSFLTGQTNAGALLTTLVTQIGGDGTIYLVQNGSKYPLTHSAWLARKYSLSNVTSVSGSLLATLPTAATLLK